LLICHKSSESYQLISLICYQFSGSGIGWQGIGLQGVCQQGVGQQGAGKGTLQQRSNATKCRFWGLAAKKWKKNCES